MAVLLKGAPAAAAITENLKARTDALRSRGVIPCLAILRVGERPDDSAYERNAKKRCEKAGIDVREYHLPEDCGKEALLAAVREINEDPAVHGCLMMRPLPDREAEQLACELLAPEKDVDCMTPRSMASLFMGKGPGFPPCTAEACIALLDHYGIAIEGKRAVVVGRSLVIGKPVSLLLQNRNATVTMCHTRTKDLPAVCREAEILVAAAGKAGLLTAEHCAPGQTVVDVGIHVLPDGSLTGDVCAEAAAETAAFLTPVPGGVGAVTTAVLARHVTEAAEKRDAR